MPRPNLMILFLVMATAAITAWLSAAEPIPEPAAKTVPPAPTKAQVIPVEKPVADSPIYGFTLTRIDQKPQALSAYKGKVMLIVNTASKCGYTPQYAGLQRIYEKYREQGFEVLGFPANNFLWQEPGTDGEIAAFCTGKYKVTFPLFSKLSVKGSDQSPLYTYLTKNSPVAGKVKWNFQKYLVDRRGNVFAAFHPKVKPEDDRLIQALEAALEQNLSDPDTLTDFTPQRIGF